MADNDDAPTPMDHDTPTPATPAPATPSQATPGPSTPGPAFSQGSQPQSSRLVTQGRPPRQPRGARAGAAGSSAGTPGPAAPSPADSVVLATPAPLTPGTNRRELGLSPLRVAPLVPSSQTPGGAGGGPGSTPTPGTPGTPSANPAQMVVWGTTINIDDAERRLSEFVRTFCVGGNRSANGETAGAGAASVSTPRTPMTPASPGTPPMTTTAPRPYYMDLLQLLYETGGAVLNVDMSHLHRADPGMYRKMVTYPNELITVFDAVVDKVFAEEYPEEGAAIREKRRKGIQIRTFNLQSDNVQSMRDLNPKDISSLVAIRGMVIRVSNVIPDIQRAAYRCTRCKYMTDVAISFGRIDEPRKCPSCNARDSFTLVHSRSTFSDKQMVRLQEAPESIPKGDTPATFTLVMYDTLVDSVKPGDRVEITGIMRATPVRVNPKLRTVRSVFRTYIDCVHVRTLSNNQSRALADSSRRAAEGRRNGIDPDSNRDDVEPDLLAEESGEGGGEGEPATQEAREKRQEFFERLACHPRLYERLANSVAPSIFGMMDEKKGVLLQLFGGANKSNINGDGGEQRDDDGNGGGGGGSARFRSAINVLLIGDPGTSKSQLLHSVHRLAPRGVYTSGRGSSAVGLTAYVTKDPDSDDYVLESGALVLSDRGICCIDEFDKMSDYARSVLHEVMEQQTVSIAKAGIIATLNARTAVLAAANPVNSRYDTSKSVVDNIDLPPTLMSRFDLIYLVLDAPNAESDRQLAQHIVSLFYRNYDEDDAKKKKKQQQKRARDSGSATGAGEQQPEENEDNDDEEGVDLNEGPAYSQLLDAKTLTEYIAFCRSRCEPRLSPAASDALIEAYLEMRAGGRGGGNMTATPRQLESLIRLAEAHARMQLRDEVSGADVAEAARLVKSALHMAAYDPNTGKIDMNLFATGATRAGDGDSALIAQAVVARLEADGGERQELSTARLLAAVQANADAEVSAGDVRAALRRLEEQERIVMTSGGASVRLV